MPEAKADPETAELHRSIPVVDLLVGSAIMRPDFAARRRAGHVDLPRALDGGLDLLGLSIATRLPDLRGTWSTPFFWSQGVPFHVLRSDMAIANFLIDRVEGWQAEAAGRLTVVRSRGDLEAVGTDGSVRAFLGIQGGHVLEGDLRNLERLRDRGLRMFAPAHVMDNALVGSSTGVKRGGLTAFGREALEECRRLGVLVDLAHMSERGVRDALPLLKPPFVLSHTGFTALAGDASRFRNYTPGTRNVSTELARDVAQAGGVIGLTLSSWLLGGETLEAFGVAVDFALDVAGADGVAIGSDMDGGLRMLVDAARFAALTGELLRRGHSPAVVAGVMGGNALRALKTAFPSA